MCRFPLRWVCAALCYGWLVVGPVSAQETTDEQLFQKVMNRLMKTDLFVREYPSKFVYPPKTFIKPKSLKELNAYATASKAYGAIVDDKTGKIQPAVMITEGYLKVIVKGDENSLGVIMGHELAHLTKEHVVNRPGETGLLMLSFSRDHEIEADLDGVRYAVAAGYPYKAGFASAIREMRAIASIEWTKPAVESREAPDSACPLLAASPSRTAGTSSWQA
jgi:Zn-dependent protease with chaperone function